MVALDHQEQLVMPERDDDRAFARPEASDIIVADSLRLQSSMQTADNFRRHPASKQLLVTTDLNNFALIHYDNLVSVHNR